MNEALNELLGGSEPCEFSAAPLPPGCVGVVASEWDIAETEGDGPRTNSKIFFVAPLLQPKTVFVISKCRLQQDGKAWSVSEASRVRAE